MAGEQIVFEFHEALPIILVTISGTDINTGQYVCEPDSAARYILVDFSGNSVANG